MGKFYIEDDKLWGKYRAEVLKIDDPEKRGRVLVKCPSVLPDTELGWADSCFPPGIFDIPNKGDLVWIEFENGDINFPIWVGIMPTKEYVKSKFFPSESYDPKVRMWVTDAHHTKFYDSKARDRVEYSTNYIKRSVSHADADKVPNSDSL